MNILLIEENDLVRAAFRRMLATAGISATVTETDNGIEGLAMAQLGRYDLIITDWLMPGMDGCRVAAMLRLIGCDTPIVLITGSPGDEIVQKHFDMKTVDVVMPKPWDIRFFVSVVNAAKIASLLRHG